ncbi:MAG: two pore domain potassium channel family protein [Flavobacteriaceae bacterium]|nr:two pore domain potassium channel family protein [Flavobacteriaceae bacterium]
MINTLYNIRFELFFYSLICVLFGSLFFPLEIYADTISPVLFLLNFLSGMLFFIHRKKQVLIVVLIFIIALGIFLFNTIGNTEENSIRFLRLVLYFIFYCLVTLQIIGQVWNAETVNRSVIFGMMCGYISLGLLGFFTFFIIELATPGSFNGILIDLPISAKIEELLYFSYITIMTIGYGDISPATDMAQKATMLVGMIGQFYLVIVTAVVIEKYIRHTHKA